MRLQDKTALVTGATSGIGEAIAHAFAREGAQVVITGRNTQRGHAVVDTIRAAGGSAHFVMADLTSQQDIHNLVGQTQTAVGLVDILVNNAAIFPMGATADIDEATFDAAMATNVKAPFFLTAALAPQMALRRSGKIINVTTVVAQKGVAGTALYGATKAALTLLTRSWADEFGPSGMNVNALVPHLIRTPGTEEQLENLEQISRSLPARRYALPEEVAEAALYLARVLSTSHYQGLRLADSTYGRTIRDLSAGSEGLGGRIRTCYRVPDREAFLTHLTVLLGAKAMAAKTKVVTNETVRRQKSLRMAW